MKKEQYEFCLSFYEICNKYLNAKKDHIILDDFYDAYDLAQMLHTYIDCIPETKIYLLRELFTFLNKYKNKVEENDYLPIWQKKIIIENNKENLNKVIENTKLKRKIMIVLLLTGAITTSAFFSQTKTCQKIIDNLTEFFTEDDSLKLERKKY